MNASELINIAIPPFKSNGSIKSALEIMAEFKIYHIPVVANKQFIGLVSEEELVHLSATTDTLMGSEILQKEVFVLNTAHPYEVVKLFSEFKISVIPVVSQTKKYLGLINTQSIIDYSSIVFSAMEVGGILVLEVNNRDNSLAHMAQIVEADNAQILSSYVKNFQDSTQLEITIKINKTDLSAIIAAFERYNYKVKEVYYSNSEFDDSTDRYDSLMNYLNI